MLDRFFTRDQQDFVRDQRTINQLLTGGHIIARVNAESFSRWNEVFLFDSGLCISDHNRTLTTFLLFENFHLTVDVSQNRRIFRLTSLENLGNTWQTTCNVRNTRSFTRRFRDRRTSRNNLAVLNQNVSPLRQVINIASDRTVFGIFQDQLRMSIASEVDNASSHLTAGVSFFFNRFAVDDVFETNLTFDFAQQRNRKRVPVTKHVTRFDFAFIADIQNRTSWNLVSLQLATTRIENRNLTGSVQNNRFTFVIGHITHPRQFDFTRTLGFLFVLFRTSQRSHTTKVERTHRQLSTRLSNTLSRDNSDRHPFFDHIACGHIHSVATLANTQRGVASHRAADLNFLQTHVFDFASDLHSDHLVLANDNFVRHRVDDVLTRNATNNRCRQTNFDILTTINDTFGNTLCRFAVVHRDHNVLRDVSQLTSQVTRVSRLERGISQTLASTVCRREILQHGQTFAEVRLNWRLHNLTRRLGHQTTHTGQLTNLFDTTTSTRARHEEYRVHITRTAISFNSIVVLHRFHHLLGNLLTSMSPSIEHFVVTLFFSNHTTIVVLTELENIFLRSRNDRRLFVWSNQVVGRERQTRAETLTKAQAIHIIQQVDRFSSTQRLIAIGNHCRQIATLHRIVVIVQTFGQHHIELHAAKTGFNDLAGQTLFFVQANKATFWQANFDFRVHMQNALLISRIRLFQRGEHHSLAALPRQHQRDVVTAHHRILRRTHNRLAVGRSKNIVRRQHQRVSFDLSFDRKRKVHSHLVTVKVCIETFTNQWMQVNRVTLDQSRLERLNSHTVQRRSTVEQHRMILDHLLQDIPDLFVLTLQHLFR